MADIPWWDPIPITDGKVIAPDSEGLLYDDSSPWARVDIGGHRLPGTCSVTGAAVHRIDIQKSNGVDGGTIIERGYVPGKYDIECKIWTEAQWNAWQEIYPQIFRRPGKIDVNDAKAKKAGATAAEIKATEKAALTISHPFLALAGVSACLVESIPVPRPGPEWGTWVITIKVVQYIAPVPKQSALRKGTGAKENVPLVKELQPATNKPKKPSEDGDGGPNGAPKGSGQI